MKLGEYRVVYNAYYNYRAVHDVEKRKDTWTVEEQCQFSFFGLTAPWFWWAEHKEPDYDCEPAITFMSTENAFSYVERLLNGSPRGTTISTVVTEVDHERIN